MSRLVPLACGISASWLLLAAPGGFAQSGYPAKPVRVVVPFTPGGSNDIAARLVSQELTKLTGQQFVVDNRPGASGLIGAEIVAKSPPDGYTFMVHSNTHLSNAFAYKKIPYDTLRDFTPLALLVAQPGVLVVHPSLPARTVKEFIALARKRPNEITYASNGQGGNLHMQMALFASMANIKLIHVPYKGGAPVAASLVAGETQSSTSTIGIVLPHLKSGRLRPLGVTSARRSGVLPDVPTIAEAGLPGYDVNPWVGSFMPAGTPPAIVERLHADINRIMQRPEIVKHLASLALDPWVATRDEFQQRIVSDYALMEKIIRLTGAPE